MIIELEQGLVEGGEDYSRTTGRKFYTFYGIPYGQPPVGELRFRPPVPAGKWSGVREAKTPRDWCIQNHFVTQNEIGSEDCLFVNVFIPRLPDPRTSLKPVMVHVCGGGYTEHVTGSFDHLVDYDVIMVSVSYRLHVLGFLNLNTPSCAGNCACKDIVLGLKWIKNNIREFGGDPNNITVYGESAGGALVHFLCLSPTTKGLFQKAIISAGTALVPWAFNEDQVEVGFKIGRALGFDGTDPEELASFLRQQSSTVLKDAASEQYKIFCQTHPFSIDLLFTPSLEKFREDAFICDHPQNLAKTAHPIPTITGVCTKDGNIICCALASAGETLMRLKDDLSDLIKAYVPYCHPSDVPKIAEEVRKFYLQDVETNGKLESRLIDIFTDLIFLRLYDSFEYVIKSKESLYIFEFDYVGNLNESGFWPNGFRGYAGHADESNYVTLSRGWFPKPQTDDADKEMIRKMCTFYTNFARTGDPNPYLADKERWKMHSSEDPWYLNINSKSTLIHGEIFERGRAFWRRIMKDYYGRLN